MEPESQQAPPVVAVVVTHEPGSWFDETLDAFAAQDYPNLRLLFLDTSTQSGQDSPSVTERVAARLPDAFVREVGSNPGYGVVANEVLHLVEGDNGFFLFSHDDVAPGPSAIRLLVEELYRSNAGAVGPKLVDWDDPMVLQSVGLGLDRFGEIDVGIEPGERDQEQHDGVRDVFVIPSAFFLIRADLFRTLGGFDPAIDFYGDDVEICWRLHHSGARVVVVPIARVRHREELPERRPDLSHRTLAARHRMRAVATLTGGSRLPGRSIEMAVLTLFELVVGLFTGRFGEALSSLRALVGLIPRTPALLARRRTVKPLRKVPEREVAGLQERGSTRVNHFLRSRETTTFVGAERTVRRWRESAAAPVFAWIAVLIGLVVGSRTVLTGGFPSVGEFLPFPESPRDLLSNYASGWNSLGLGSTAANPTGWATIGLLSVTTLFRMGLFHTLFLLGLVVAGVAGMSRLVSVFPSTRARVAGMLVYAASPLVGGAMSIGSFNTLVAYASVPWIVHLMSRAVGIGTADPRTADLGIADGIERLDLAERLRRVAVLSIVIALGAAFTPFVLVLAVALAVVLSVSTLLALASWRTSLAYLVVGMLGSAVGLALNLPWFTTWTWDALVGAPPIGNPGDGALSVAAFEIGVTDFAYLSLALYLPVLAALLLARAWRLTWAVRAAMIVVGFGALAILGDRDALPFQAPEAGILLVPVAVGLGISGGAALAAFDLDVRGGSFGWRQPLGLLASAAVVVGLAPGLVAVLEGSWNMPSTTMADVLDRRFSDVEDGRFNVLMLGDARILPVPAQEYRDGIAWAVMGDGSLEFTDRWPAPGTDVDDTIVAALDQVSSSSTQRAGQLLAPLGIRYIAVPEFDGVQSTADDPLPLPVGLVEAFDDQLDIVSIPGLPTLELFENRAWIPAVGELTGATAAASSEDSAAEVVSADLSEARPVFTDADPLATSVDRLTEGSVVHMAVPFDEQWRVRTSVGEAAVRPSFGVLTAFDVADGGQAELNYETSGGRTALVVLQTLLWVLVLFGATQVSVPITRRRLGTVSDETLISFNETDTAIDEYPIAEPEPEPEQAAVLRDPGLDATGELSRIGSAEAESQSADDADASREHP